MKAGIKPSSDLYERSPSELKSMSDGIIESMNGELEITRERVRIRKEYATELELRLKNALDKLEEYKFKLGKIGSGSKGVYLGSNAKLERSEMVERIKKSKKEIISIAASFKGEASLYETQDFKCSEEVQHLMGSKSAGAVNSYLQERMEKLKKVSIGSTQDYKTRGVVDDATNIAEHELLNLKEEFLLASDLSKHLLKEMREMFAADSDRD